MQTWPVQDAKARFSEFLDACLVDGPQVVTRRGTETAVLVPLQDWHRMTKRAKPNLKELLLSDEAKIDDLPIPERGKARRRKIEEFI